MTIIPIRCCNKNERSPYNTCGALIGAIQSDSIQLHTSIFMHCPKCPRWYEISQDYNGGVSIKKLKSNTKFNFEDTIKKVEE